MAVLYTHIPVLSSHSLPPSNVVLTKLLTFIKPWFTYKIGTRAQAKTE